MSKIHSPYRVEEPHLEKRYCRGAEKEVNEGVKFDEGGPGDKVRIERGDSTT